jgi:hypothetical protein
MTEPYRLEKPLWTGVDFEVMGWHDSRVWAMVADEEKFEFAVDLDYIFKWVHPGPGETHFRFWVAPVTMVFENAYEVTIDIRSRQGGIEVADLHREDPKPTPNGAPTDHLFRLECQEGEISLRATGFRMYVRAEPRLMQGQSLSLEERGGISVERRAIAI